jgi:hypothetical protein
MNRDDAGPPRQRPVLLRVVLAVVGCSLLCSPARSDTLLLTHGGQITGEIQNPDQVPRTTYVLKTPEGAVVTLDRGQVKQVVRRRAVDEEYESVRPRYPDTVEGQWELAEWCREKGLSSQRRVHLRRVIELDPNHKQARSALGYTWKDGRWSTQEEIMKERGLVLYKGRWMTPQRVEILREQQQRDVAEKEWIQKIERWRSWLGTDRDRVARESILAINDPVAMKGLAAAMTASADPRARILFAKALSQQNTSEARLFLAYCAIVDGDEEVRHAVIVHLKKSEDFKVVEYFVGRLKDKENLPINRAAAALKELEQPSTVGPLIDALVTVHKRKIRNPEAGQTTAGFSNAGPSGLSVGAPKYIIITERLSNRAVLEALVALTGVNHGFDVAAWKSWYASQKRRDAIDARRS